MSNLSRLKKYFKIQELVDEDVYKRFGEYAWQFIDHRLIDCLLFIREELGKPMIANNWHAGGKFSQRGLRHNRSSMVIGKKRPYLSAHMMGKALDFDVIGMDAESVRNWIVEHKKELPHKIRLEHKMNATPIPWVHLDVFDNEDNDKIKLFNV